MSLRQKVNLQLLMQSNPVRTVLVRRIHIATLETPRALVGIGAAFGSALIGTSCAHHDYVSISLLRKNEHGKVFETTIGPHRLRAIDPSAYESEQRLHKVAYRAIAEEFQRRNICLKGFEIVQPLAGAEGGILSYEVFCPGKK